MNPHNLPETRVAPMPAGVAQPLSDLARAAGCASVGELQSLAAQGDVPNLPHAVRIGGSLMVSSDAARLWLHDLARRREAEPQRRERENREARERHEAAMRDKAARYAAEWQATVEQQAAFRAAEVQHAEEREAEAEASRKKTELTSRLYGGRTR